MPKRLGAWKQAGPKRKIVSVKAEQLKPQVAQYLNNYRQIRDILEELCAINRELLRRREAF